jgi:UBA/TS-N domain
MLVAALPNYAGGPLVPPAKDALGFVAALHARVLAAVLPLWSHPVACHAPPGVLTSLIRVLQTCAQGPGHASLILRYSQAGRAPAPRPVPQPDPALVQQIVEMGFAQARAEEALRRVGANSVELAMEWLILHPEEHQQPAQAADGETPMAAATAASAGSTPASQAALATAAGEAEEEELTRALLASLSMVGMSPSTVAHQQAAQQQLLLESAPQLPLAAPGANRATDAAELSEEQHLLPSATAAAPPTTLAETSTSATAAMTCPTAPPTQAGTAQAGGATAEAAGIPEPAQLVDGAVRLAAAVPVTAFSIAELLATIAQRGSDDRRSVVACLLDGCLPRASGAAAAKSGALLQAAGTELICARLLLLLLQKDGPSRVVAADQGLPGRALAALEGWQQHYASLVQAWQAEGQQQQDAAMLEVPVLVEALLLLLDAMATTTPASGSGSGSSRGRQGAQGQAARHVGQVAPSAPGNSAAAPAAPSASAEAALDTAAAAPAATAHPQHPDADVAMQEATAGSTSAAAGGSGSDTCPATDWATGVERVKLPAELGALPGLAAALNGWWPCGALNEQQQAAATSLCVALLQQLHDHASTWEHSDRSMFDADCGLPSPAALTHALLQLLGHLTKRYANAQQVLGVFYGSRS